MVTILLQMKGITFLALMDQMQTEMDLININLAANNHN
jgi:hypothetical protein